MNQSATKLVSFFRKSKKGKVIRLTKNEYLRSDIESGVLNGKQLTVKALIAIIANTCINKHALILDSDICSNEIDILEAFPQPSVVIILQSVLQTIRNLNVSSYKRLCALLEDDSKLFVFFPNEVFTETIELMMPHDNLEEFNNRNIQKSVVYFNRALNGIGEAFLLSNHEHKIQCCGELKLIHIKHYVETYLNKYPTILDLLSANTDEYMKHLANDSNDNFSFPAYATIEEIELKLKTKQYFSGLIRCQNNDYTNCYVNVSFSDSEGSSVSVKIEGYQNVNRAVDGDRVAIEIVSKPEDTSATDSLFNQLRNNVDIIVNDAVKIVESVAEDDVQPIGTTVTDDNEYDDVATKTTESSAETVLYGKVVGVIRRNWRQYAGSLITLGDYIEKTNNSDLSICGANTFVKKLHERHVSMDTSDFTGTNGNAAEFMLFIAYDQRLPPVLIKTRFANSLVNHRVLVGVDQWHSTSLFPWGHYIKCIGKEGDAGTETEVLLHEFDVRHESFSAEVMSCLPSLDWKINDSIVSQRLDLRHVPVVSIDPPGCKDIDDALHCTRLANGNLQVGVHIADVSFFVHADTALDLEAANRSTSTYLVERRLDMLPSYLTAELCSLRSKEDHLAFSVLWEMDLSGNILDVSFHKSVIHSVASLTYDEAQAILDDKSLINSSNYQSSIHLLNNLAKIFRDKRIMAGGLTLSSPEVRFKMDSESQNPTDVSMYSLKESNALVEEFMLLANITVSKQILKHFPTLSVLRRHQAPSQLQFSSLLNQASIVGVNLDITSSKALADSLDLAQKEGDAYFNKLLRILTTRCMKPAQYFCSGEMSSDFFHHYGLAAPVYTHFTSPIRRYADLIVHRLLAASIGVIPLSPSLADRSKLQKLCVHMNRRHKAAQYVQRASVNLHTVIFFKNRTSTRELAYILSINAEKIIAFVPRFALEGSMTVAKIQDQLNAQSSFDEKHCILTFHSKSSNSILLQLQVFKKCDVCIKTTPDISGNSCLQMNIVVDTAIDSSVNFPSSSEKLPKKQKVIK